MLDGSYRQIWCLDFEGYRSLSAKLHELGETRPVTQPPLLESLTNLARALNDFFGAETLVNPDAGHASPEDVDRFWRDYLGTDTQRIDRKAFAEILERTDWFPGDPQASLVRLIDAGSVRNLDAMKRRRKKPLHYDIQGGERLQRLEK